MLDYLRFGGRDVGLCGGQVHYLVFLVRPVHRRHWLCHRNITVLLLYAMPTLSGGTTIPQLLVRT